MKCSRVQFLALTYINTRRLATDLEWIYIGLIRSAHIFDGDYSLFARRFVTNLREGML
jgi:hypothetical protein